MTEDQIERKVQKLIDALDKRFIEQNSSMSLEEYDKAMEEIDRWAGMEYRRKDGPAPYRENFRNYS